MVVMNALARWSWIFAVLGGLFAAIALTLYLMFGQLGTVGSALLVVGGVLFIAWAAFDKENLQAGFSTRQFRYGSGSVLVTAMVGVLAIGAYVLSTQHDTRWDWSRTDRFSLSERTLQTVRGLDRDVQILAFFREGTFEDQRFRTLIEGYQNESDRLTVRFVDPDVDPRLASDNTVTSEYGTVLLQSGDDHERIEANFGEESLTDAILRVLAGEDHRICWATGHGEIDVDDDQTPGGMGLVVLKLEDRNYQFTKSAILLEGVDPDCEALIVAAPQRDWEPGERDALAEYIARGGKALLLLEPESVPELSADMARYGIEVGNDLVIDPSLRARSIDIEDPAFLIATVDGFALHPVTESLRAPVLIGASRSIAAMRGAQGYVLHELIVASPESWGETALDKDPYEDPNAWVPNEGSERVGSVPLLTASTIADPLQLGTTGADHADDLVRGGVVVVAGTADFARNALVTRAANQDLFDNLIGWLVDDSAPLAPGPEGEADVLYLDLIRLAIAVLTSVIILPGLAVLAAMIAAVRRRFQ